MEKIVLFIDSLGSGGAQRQIVNLANFLTENNYEVHLLIYESNLFYKDNLSKNVILKVFEDTSKFKIILKLSKYIKKNNIKKCYQFFKCSIYYYFICKNPNSIFFKVFVSIRSDKISTLKNSVFLLTLFRFSDKIIVNSNNTKNMLLKHFGFSKKKNYCDLIL